MIKLGSIEFDSKKKIILFIGNLMKEKGFGFKIYPGDPLFDVFFDLLKLHPEFDDKVKYGLQYFHFGRNQLHDHIEIQVVGSGGYTAMGWMTCLSGKSKDKLDEALREAISEQIFAFKDSTKLPDVCPVCNDRKTEYHVDHIVKFKDIRDEFVSIYGRPMKFIKLKNFKAAISPDEILYINRWREFHLERARLRYICAECNMRLGYRLSNLTT